MTIYLDFDGTVVEHAYPSIGRFNPHAVRSIRKLQDAGHDIVLNTLRAEFKDDSLKLAINYLKNAWMVDHPTRDLELLPFSVSDKKLGPAPFFLFDELQIYSSTSSGEYIFIDDQSLGTPMVGDSRGGFMVDWPAVMEILKNYKLVL